MVSPVPNIEATMAETQSNTTSLFAREPAGSDYGQCQCCDSCNQPEARQRIGNCTSDSAFVTTTLSRDGLIDYREVSLYSVDLGILRIKKKKLACTIVPRSNTVKYFVTRP